MGKKHAAALREVIEALGLTQAQAAARLRELTEDDKPSTRTVRTWLASADAGTKVECPGWPVFVLRTELRRSR